ncbi:hypothetical protein D3M70_06840 [Pseudomonas sp. LS-2]|nr:hypothetical protein D3M70_06840 [Pseudomonas sp. LS-2]
MIDQSVSTYLKAVAFLSCWIVVFIIVAFCTQPPWEVFIMLLEGLAPFIVAAIVYAGVILYGRLTEPEWRKRARGARKSKDRIKTAQRN